MKNKIVTITVVVLILMIVAAIVLNMCPGVEAALHKMTGWN